MRLELTDDNIDERNRPLLEELMSKGLVFYLEIFCYKNEDWVISKSEETYNIIIRSSQPNYEQLAHELLHAWLENKGFYDKRELDIKLSAASKTKLIKDVFGLKACNNFYQCIELTSFNNDLAHVHMFDKFVALGYEKEKFLFSNLLFKDYLEDLQRRLNPENLSNYVVLKTFWSIKLYQRRNNLNKEEESCLLNILRRKNVYLFQFAERMYSHWLTNNNGYNNLDFFYYMIKEYKN